MKTNCRDYNSILEIPPYSLSEADKNTMLTDRLAYLTQLHADRCADYAAMLAARGFTVGGLEPGKICSDTAPVHLGIGSDTGLAYGLAPGEIGSHIDSHLDIPFLPVALFKELDLLSVPKDDVVKTMTSSGTTGQAVSKIYLDKETSTNQQKTLVKIVNEFTGRSRMPMIIIDSPSVLKDRNAFSARGAGILGFSIFGADKIYALDDDMNLDMDGLEAFLKKHEGKRILLFGFTFMIWQHFFLKLKELDRCLDLSDAVLIHGGGWKKLISESVTSEVFRKSLNEVCGIQSVHDYYGMVEQTGCIYMECGEGHLHASVFSDVVMRRAADFSVCEVGEPGIIQVLSTIPESYPGHALLTEDEGVLLGVDDCPCGRLGKYFKVNGRIKNAEIRGCGDTYAQKF